MFVSHVSNLLLLVDNDVLFINVIFDNWDCILTLSCQQKSMVCWSYWRIWWWQLWFCLGFQHTFRLKWALIFHLPHELHLLFFNQQLSWPRRHVWLWPVWSILILLLHFEHMLALSIPLYQIHSTSRPLCLCVRHLRWKCVTFPKIMFNSSCMHQLIIILLKWLWHSLQINSTMWPSAWWGLPHFLHLFEHLTLSQIIQLQLCLWMSLIQIRE